MDHLLYPKDKRKEAVAIDDRDKEKASLQSAFADSFEATPIFNQVLEDEKLRPASPSLPREQWPRSSVTASFGNQDSSMRQRSAPLEAADDGTDDYMDEEQFAIWIAQQHQEEMRRFSATFESAAETQRKSSVIIPRNAPITYPFESLNEYTYDDVKLSPRSCVELRDGDFLKIVHIVRDTLTSEITIRGYIYRRTREMNGLLDRKLNEVCWILHVDDDDPREPLIQGVETRAVSEVIRRRNIRSTNLAFPALSFRDEAGETEEVVTNYRVLVCRYKYLCLYPNAKARSMYAWCEKGLHRIRAGECDERSDNNMADQDLRHAWRGDTQPGGAQEGWLSGEKEFLRQEANSHKGVVSRQSLKVPNGMDFPVGDPMKRGVVGSILCQSDLSWELPASAGPANMHSTFNVNTLQSKETASASDELEELVSPYVHAVQHRPGPRQHRSPLSAFNKLAMDAHEYDLAKVKGSIDLSNTLRESGIETPKAMHKAPQIVEINAQVKTSTSAGTSMKRYESRITSSFVPRPSSKRKRSDTMSDQPRRPRGEKGDYSRGTSPSDSDETVGHSQSEGFVQELRAPPKSGGSIATKSRLFTPPSLGSNDATRSSIYTSHRESMLRRNLSLNHNVDVDDVIDLTAAPAHTSSRFQSELRKPPMPGPVDSRSNGPQKHFRASPHILARTMPARTMPARTMPACTMHARTIPARHPYGSPKAKWRRYTFGDCFCGAGGMSRGAINAGLRIKWGFDFNQVACQTYATNFFGTPVYQVWANEFANGKGDHKCDVCHLSPPCQFWSDAHTTQGKDDDMNTASLFAISHLLEKAKPRVVTLEQTSGLIRRHPLFFNAVINMFTSRGFSVRWRVMNCADFGVPQRRLRLFIIASCPGEVLPPFPKPTHSANAAQTGLKPWTTIDEAISSIPPGWDNHDLHSAKPRNATPTPGDKIASCITTNGGPGNIHPSGKRDYTHREYTCLQKFPLGHKFGGTGVKRQIGNAVPPVMATALLEAVVRSLLVADGLA